jgi:hypothetical protein
VAEVSRPAGRRSEFRRKRTEEIKSKEKKYAGLSLQRGTWFSFFSFPQLFEK